MKIVSLNIEFNKHLDLIIPFFQKENADVLLLQEVLEENLETLKQELGMNYLFAPQARIKFSFGVKVLGLAVFSRKKIEENKNLYYVGTYDVIPNCDITEPEKTNRVILVTWVGKNSKEFCLVNTHFTWAPDGGPNFRQKQDLKKLLKLLSPLNKFVLTGDFNAPRGREIFDKLASVYKDNIPKNVTTTLDKNWHYAGDLQLVIDGLFSTPGYVAKNVRLVSGVSDHLAIVANIRKVIDNK